MVEGQPWSTEESSVLVAIFGSNEFSIGDDEREENHRIAKALGRSPGAIDMQWRNIDAIYKCKPHHVGYNIEQATKDYESDPRTTRLEAVEICRKHGWDDLISLIGPTGIERAADSRTGDSELSVVSVDDVPIAAMNVEWAEVERLTINSVVYREAQLTERFRAYLLHAGREVVRYRITHPGLPALYTDMADATEGVLYEAKGSSERASIRLALGQILDYSRCIQRMSLAVLLPSHPQPDLIRLLRDHNVGCVVEDPEEGFADLTGLRRCP